MKIFTINTHHAYLNTVIRLVSLDGANILITDKSTGNSFDGNDIKFRLSAGMHELTCMKDGRKQVEYIEIEDAIKLGGGRIKKAFVFDSTPWLFVIMKDRLYCFNEDTKEERIEYGLSPDQIIFLEEHYFLFVNSNDYSVYNVENNDFVYRFSNHIYSNDHVVVYKKIVLEEEKLIVYDYITEQTILTLSKPDKWSLEEDTIFFSNIQNRHFESLDLKTNELVVLNVSKFVMFSNFQIVGHYVLDYREGAYYNYNFIDLCHPNENDYLPHISISTNFHIVGFLGKEMDSIQEMREKYDIILKNNRKDISDASISLLMRYYRVSTVLREDGDKIVMYIRDYQETSKHRPSVNHIIKVNVTSGAIDLDKANSYVDMIPSEEKEQKESFHQEGLASSASGNISILKEDGNIFRYDKVSDVKEQILVGVYDKSHFPNAYFTRDGNHIIVKSLEKELNIIGFDDMEEIPFSIEGTTVPDGSYGFNGYQLVLSISEGTSRGPVWRDPITLQKINMDEISNRIYLSPDKNWSAKTTILITFVYLPTQKEMTPEEKYNITAQWTEKYDWKTDAKEEEKKEKESLRRKLINENVFLKNKLDEFYRPVGKYSYYTGTGGPKLLEDRDVNEKIDNLLVQPLLVIQCK